jgi:hypothetical protein
MLGKTATTTTTAATTTTAIRNSISRPSSYESKKREAQTVVERREAKALTRLASQPVSQPAQQ